MSGSCLNGVEEALGRGVFQDAVPNLLRYADSRSEAALTTLSLFALYNHPSGFFARAEANWYQQNNDANVTSATYGVANQFGQQKAKLTTQNLGVAGDDFWQFNVLAGYRFHRNQCEVSAGLLNVTGQDYRLLPVNPYEELARDRTLVVRCRLSF